MTTTTATEITFPAERIREGIARQTVNHYNYDGTLAGTHTYRGTERQARAYAALQHMHDTDPAWKLAMAILRGEA
ncbi:hypothetical protein [Microtetraspora malaysiensis]|uniref:hypothetical protein n=1 Tax=Microtetraspora malaysiensis TaxID=161358 RepID=UPI003D8E7891